MKDHHKATSPLVSVIIPAYNAEAFIGRTIQSVLLQTYRHIEVIVVDDGSCDRTAEIVRSFEKQDDRVVLLQQSNAGVAAARNLAIDKSQGDLIAPVDADDIWYAQKLEKQVQYLSESFGLVYTWSVDIDEQDLATGTVHVSFVEGEVFARLVCRNFLCNASTPLIRRTCIEKVGGYDCSLRAQQAQGCEDWDLYLRIAEHYQFRVVPEFLVGYRQLTNSMSCDYTQMARSHTLMVQSVQQKHPEIPQALYQLSTSNLNLYFARQSSCRSQYRTALDWLYLALEANWFMPFFRFGFYRVLLVSLLRLKSSEKPEELCADSHPEIFANNTVNSTFQEQLKNIPRNYDRSKTNIALKIYIGSAFDTMVKLAIKAKEIKDRSVRFM